jgi:4-amino-4-deoxy-L-arabinose transferase-like glycosyltransferase
VTSPPPSRESLWGGPRTILGLVLVGAAALRLVGVRYGLPHGNILNPDEQAVVPRAWDVTHGWDLDPHPYFDWPSLLFYVLAPFQWWQEAPSYLSARLVVVALGVAGVAAAWWLGERSYGVVAGGVAGVATGVAGVHVAYSRMAVTDVLLTTLVTIALALLVSGRIELAGLVAGFAIAAKWPGIVLAVPLLVVGWGRWRQVGAAAGLALVGFAAGSPFALVHAGEAMSDWWRVSNHAREGWLGFEHDSFSAVAFSVHLWDALGPALVVAVAGLCAALALRGPADRVLAAFAVAYFMVLLPLESHFDRYALPLVPVLGVLAGRFRAVAPVTLLLLVVPLTWSVREAKELTKTDTRVVAQRRLDALAVGTGFWAVDPSAPRPSTRGVIELALPAPWADPDPLRDVGRLRAERVRYVVATGAIADRVRAAPEEYPQEVRFYEQLERTTERAWRIDPGADLAGPWVALYRLPDS